MSQEAWLVGLIAKMATTGSGTFYEAVGGRIYRHEAPLDTDEALAVVTVVSDLDVLGFGSSDDIDAEFQVDIYGARDAGETAAQGINDKLYTLLHGAAITITGFNGGKAQRISRPVVTIDDARARIMTMWRLFATKQ